jgi:hypothetical protein
MEAIAAAQQEIQDELKALQEDLRRHAADAAKDFPKAAASAVEIANEIGKRQIPDLMGAAHDGFSEARGPEGFANAQKALDAMEAMMPKGGECKGNAKGELDIKLGRSLSKPGLGQSLGDCMSPGLGPNSGSGSGSGSGGQMSGGSSKASEGGSQQGPVAYTMDMKDLAGKSGTKKMHAANRMAGTAAALSTDRIEVLGDGDKSPPKASDSALKAYPPEYRKLIRDYFISVTHEKGSGEKKR